MKKCYLAQRISMFLLGLMCITAVFAQDPNTTKKPLLTIGCLSDMHSELSLINPTSGKVEDVRLRGTILNTLKGMFENEDLDMILLTGDCTSDVTIPRQNWERVRELMHEAFRSAFRPERTRRPVIYITGNHDYEVANFDNIPKSYNAADYLPIMEEDIAKLEESEKFYEEADNGTLGTMRVLAAFHYVINGFDFVMLNCGKNFFKSAWDYTYSHESVAWVDKKLEEIYNENPNKTVFFALHIPFGDSNSISAYSKGIECRDPSSAGYELKQALAKHPNLIMLYGHDHGTNTAFIRTKTAQRVTRYDTKGNVIDTYDDTHVDAYGSGDEEPAATTQAYWIKSVPTGGYLWYDGSNNIETTTAESTCSVTNNNGSFTINIASGRDLHIGSNGRFSGGSASAITLYRVADPSALTYVGTKATEIESGATYLITSLYNNEPYALSNQLYNADTGDNQRMESTKISVSGNTATIAANPDLLWTISEPVDDEPQGTTDLTKGKFFLWNEGAEKYLNIDSNNLSTSTVGMECSFSYSGGFKIGLSAQSLHIGSNGRFSRGSASTVDLYKVEDIDAETITATKVTTFDVDAHYLIVGTYNNGKYALSCDLYNAGAGDDQRLEGVAVTETDGTITFQANKNIIWTVKEIPAAEFGVPSFFSSFVGSMRYYNNSIEGDVSVSNSKIVQALMVYIYDDHIYLQTKNYGDHGTFNGITINEELVPYVVYRKVERSHTTGVDTHIESSIASKGIYDLQGRRVKNARRGVFIVDNHKVMIR